MIKGLDDLSNGEAPLGEQGGTLMVTSSAKSK